MLEGLTVEKISLTANACWDILETAVSAGGHGISYWAHPTLLERHSEGEMVLALEDLEGVENNGALPKKYRIHASQVRTAVLAILRNPEATEAHHAATRLMDQQGLDGPLADQIIQVACFGKVIYG